MSTAPRKRAPSATMIFGALMLPSTVALATSSTRSSAETSPVSLPSTVTFFACTVASTRAFVPMRRSLVTLMRPLIVPSTTTASEPLTVPSMTTFGPKYVPLKAGCGSPGRAGGRGGIVAVSFDEKSAMRARSITKISTLPRLIQQ